MLFRSQKYFTRRREIHGACKVEQRGLTAAAAPNQGHKFTGFHAERKTMESTNGLAVGQVVLRNVLQRQYGHVDWPAGNIRRCENTAQLTYSLLRPILREPDGPAGFAQDLSEARASSIAEVTCGESGVISGSKRAMTRPSGPMRNLVKFHLISPPDCGCEDISVRNS